MRTPATPVESKSTTTASRAAQGKGQTMPFFQTKLTVNQPGDAYEQEADRVADQVMRMPDPVGAKSSEKSDAPGIQRQTIAPTATPTPLIAPKIQQANSTPQLVQTKCADCAQKEQAQKEEERPEQGTGQVMRSSKMHDINGSGIVPIQRACKACAEAEEVKRKEKQPDIPGSQAITVQRACADCADDDTLQRSESTADAGGQMAPSIVSNVLNSGGGRPMDAGTRNFMESRFGQDFGQVRIHTGGKAAESAAAINARAYTSGSNVVFGNGEYQPESEGGRRLLAHELVHVGQQGGEPPSMVQMDTNKDVPGPKTVPAPTTPTTPDSEPIQDDIAPHEESTDILYNEVVEISGSAPPEIPDDSKGPPVKYFKKVIDQNKKYWDWYKLSEIKPLRTYDPYKTPNAYANRVYLAQKYLRNNNYVFGNSKIRVDGVFGPDTIIFLYRILANENFSEAHFELTGLGFDLATLSSVKSLIAARRAEAYQNPPKFLMEWNTQASSEKVITHIGNEFGDLEAFYDHLLFGDLTPDAKQRIGLGEKQTILLKVYENYIFDGVVAFVEVKRNFIDNRLDTSFLTESRKEKKGRAWIAYGADNQSEASRYDTLFEITYPNTKARELRGQIGPPKPPATSLIGLLVPFYFPLIDSEERLRIDVAVSNYFQEKAENIENFIVPKAANLFSILEDSDSWRELKAHQIDSELTDFWGRPDVFEEFLTYLERQGIFSKFIQEIEQLNSIKALEPLVRLCMQTRYKDHIAVVHANELLHKLKENIRSHNYIAGESASEQVVLLEKESDNKLSVGEVAGGYYVVSEDKQRLKEPRRMALEDKMREMVMADITGKVSEEGMNGSGGEDLNGDKYMEKILEKAAAELKIGEGDFEEVTYEQGYKLLGVKRVVHNGVEEFMVDYEKVHRTAGGEWLTLEKSPGYRHSSEFEESLGWFKFANEMETIQTIVGVAAIVIGGIVLLASGAGGALIALGGGAKMVALSIGISVLIWAITADHLTIEGFLEAVLNGYLMAVGFRLFAPLGRGAAAFIGTNTFKQKLMGLVLQSIVTGGASGAFTGPAAMLITDILKGQLGAHSIEDYWNAAKTGFKYGVLFELGGNLLLAPILRTAGKSVLERISNVNGWKAFLDKAKVAIKPGEWPQAITKSYSKCKFWLAQNLDSSIEALIAKKISESAKELLSSYTEGLLLNIHRQALDLIESGMTRESVNSLEQMITATQKRMKFADANSLIDEVLNELKKNPEGRVNQFFSLINAADDVAFNTMLANNLLDLASSDAILQLTSRYPAINVRSTLQYHFDGEVGRFNTWLKQLDSFQKGVQDDIFRLLAERGGSLTPDILLSIVKKNTALSVTVVDGLVRLGSTAKSLNVPLSNIDEIIRYLRDDKLAQTLESLRSLPQQEYERLAEEILKKPKQGSNLINLTKDFDELFKFLDNTGDPIKLEGQLQKAFDRGVNSSRIQSLAEAGVGFDKALRLSAEFGVSAVEITENFMKLGSDPIHASNTSVLAGELQELDNVLILSKQIKSVDLRKFLNSVKHDNNLRLPLKDAALRARKGHIVAFEEMEANLLNPGASKGTKYKADVMDVTKKEAIQYKRISGADEGAFNKNIKAAASQLRGESGEIPPPGFSKVAHIQIATPNKLLNYDRNKILQEIKFVRDKFSGSLNGVDKIVVENGQGSFEFVSTEFLSN